MAKQTVKSLNTNEYDALLSLLKEAREGAGVSQHGLSVKLVQPKNYIAKIESKERRLDVVEFIQIAKALSLDPVQLFTRFVDALP